MKETNPRLLSRDDLLLAIDQGTTSSRAILFTPEGKIAAIAQKELQLYYPQDGWVEQDAGQIWQDTLAVCREVIKQSGEAGGHIAALGITNQRETTVVWDRNSGEPAYNAIVWQDRRTAAQCDELRTRIDEHEIQRSTGLLIDPYFSASKIRWILDHVPGCAERAQNGELLFGTIECYLLWRLTGGRTHASDASNASRTLLFDIHQQAWSSDLLALFDIPRSMMPEVVDNTGAFGVTDKALLGAEIPLAAMIGDQQSALVGQGCLQAGAVKATYGTGCFMLMNTGTEAPVSSHKLLTTTAYRIGGQPVYAMEGSIFVAGAAIQWLRDGLGVVEHVADSEALASDLADNGNLYFVPALTGLGAPYWAPDARGAILGLTRDSTARHIVRAALEAQAYQTRDVVQTFLSDQAGVEKLSTLRVDGGLVANQFVCQMLADVLQTPVEVPHITEATAWGAASLAGLQDGVFSSLEEIAGRWQLQKRYEAEMAEEEAGRLYRGWQMAVQRLL